MPSPSAIVETIARCRAVSLIGAPATAEDATLLAEVWLEDLDALSDRDLAEACRAHRRDPDRGKFMPTPAEVLARCPRIAIAPDPDAAAWDAIVASGSYGPLGVELTEPQRVALGKVGGRWAVSRSHDGVEQATLRKRFLGACREPLALRLPSPTVPQLPPPEPRRATGTFTPWVPRTQASPLSETAAKVARTRAAIAARDARLRAEGRPDPMRSGFAPIDRNALPPDPRETWAADGDNPMEPE